MPVCLPLLGLTALFVGATGVVGTAALHSRPPCGEADTKASDSGVSQKRADAPARPTFVCVFSTREGGEAIVRCVASRPDEGTQRLLEKP